MNHQYFCLWMLVLITGCTPFPLLTNEGHLIIKKDNQVKTWKELQEKNIVMQKYDYSCGAASLATLMRYYFQEDVTEQSLLDEIERIFSAEEISIIEDKGLSFLELEKISQAKGYQTASVRLNFSALRELSGPVLVYVQPNGYKHFAILRGVVEDRVFLADPSRGNIRMSVYEFGKEWKGETLVLGKEGFGLPQHHPLSIHYKPGFRKELWTLRKLWNDYPKIRVHQR